MGSCGLTVMSPQHMGWRDPAPSSPPLQAPDSHPGRQSTAAAAAAADTVAPAPRAWRSAVCGVRAGDRASPNLPCSPAVPPDCRPSAAPVRTMPSLGSLSWGAGTGGTVPILVGGGSEVTAGVSLFPASSRAVRILFSFSHLRSVQVPKSHPLLPQGVFQSGRVDPMFSAQ